MDDLNLIFFGDFLPSDKFSSILRQEKRNLVKEFSELFNRENIKFLNLEAPLKGKSAKVKAGPNMHIRNEDLEWISSIGFDVVNLANNHIMDYGESGLTETIEKLNSLKLRHIGAGLDDQEARKFTVITKKGVKIGFIGVAEDELNSASNDKPGIASLDIIDVYQQILRARQNCDFLVLSFHGGNEHVSLPRPRLRKFCKFAINLGVDAVVCHHSHMVGTYETYKDKPIYYSLGNFLFDKHNSDKYWNIGGALKLVIHNKEIISHQLIDLNKTARKVFEKLSVEDSMQFNERIESLNEILLDERKYENAWKEIVMKKKNEYLIRQYSSFSFRGIGRIVDYFWFRSFFCCQGVKNYEG